MLIFVCWRACMWHQRGLHLHTHSLPFCNAATICGMEEWNRSRIARELIWQTAASLGRVWKINLMKAHSTAHICPDGSNCQLHSSIWCQGLQTPPRTSPCPLPYMHPFAFTQRRLFLDPFWYAHRGSSYGWACLTRMKATKGYSNGTLSVSCLSTFLLKIWIGSLQGSLSGWHTCEIKLRMCKFKYKKGRSAGKCCSMKGMSWSLWMLVDGVPVLGWRPSEWSRRGKCSLSITVLMNDMIQEQMHIKNKFNKYSTTGGFWHIGGIVWFLYSEVIRTALLLRCKKQN